MNDKREELYEKWFINQVREVHEHGMLIDVEMMCTKPALANFFNALYTKYRGQMNRKDFMSECYYWSYVAISKFTLLSGDWEGLLNETDSVNVAKLITYIKSYVQSNAIRFANPNTQFTTKSIAGKTTNIKINFEYSSLDALLTDSDGEVPLIEILGENSNLYQNRDNEYVKCEFVEWFTANREQILTKKQVLLLDNLPSALNENNNTYNGELLKEMGIDARNLTKNMNTIKSRVALKWEAYQKENNNVNQYSSKAKRSNLLQKYMNLVADERTTNKEIEQWLVANMEKHAWLEDLIQLNITQEERIACIRASKGLKRIQQATLYKINEIIYQENLKLKRLIQADNREKEKHLIEPAKNAPVNKTFKGIYTIDAFGMHHEKI